MDIQNCIDEYRKGESDIVITYTDAHRSPYYNMVKIKDDRSLSLVIPPSEAIRFRQSSPAVYDMTTVCYVANPAFILSKDYIFDGRVKGVHVPIERAIDIDTLIDFQIAEFLLMARA